MLSYFADPLPCFTLRLPFPVKTNSSKTKQGNAGDNDKKQISAAIIFSLYSWFCENDK